MARLKLALVLVTAAVCGLVVAGASADPFVGPPICSSAGAAVFGTYSSLTITGNAYVPEGKTLTVKGILTLAPGSCLDAFVVATVHVGGDILVGPGAILALGCTPGALGPPFNQGPCNGVTTNDTVDGSIVANQPLTMYLDGNTIQGNVISRGGGPGLNSQTFVNFPIKDNTIGGRLLVEGWQGGWAGAIRNHVTGSLSWSNNMSVLDPDSNEVQTNVVGGNLVCFANSPAAQVNPLDGGLPNTVAGSKIGQCAGL
jgi:hypothetical protein